MRKFWNDAIAQSNMYRILGTHHVTDTSPLLLTLPEGMSPDYLLAKISEIGTNTSMTAREKLIYFSLTDEGGHVNILDPLNSSTKLQLQRFEWDAESGANYRETSTHIFRAHKDGGLSYDSPVDPKEIARKLQIAETKNKMGGVADSAQKANQLRETFYKSNPVKYNEFSEFPIEVTHTLNVPGFSKAILNSSSEISDLITQTIERSKIGQNFGHGTGIELALAIKPRGDSLFGSKNQSKFGDEGNFRGEDVQLVVEPKQVNTIWKGDVASSLDKQTGRRIANLDAQRANFFSITNSPLEASLAGGEMGWNEAWAKIRYGDYYIQSPTNDPVTRKLIELENKKIRNFRIQQGKPVALSNGYHPWLEHTDAYYAGSKELLADGRLINLTRKSRQLRAEITKTRRKTQKLIRKKYGSKPTEDPLIAGPQRRLEKLKNRPKFDRQGFAKNLESLPESSPLKWGPVKTYAERATNEQTTAHAPIEPPIPIHSAEPVQVKPSISEVVAPANPKVTTTPVQPKKVPKPKTTPPVETKVRPPKVNPVKAVQTEAAAEADNIIGKVLVENKTAIGMGLAAVGLMVAGHHLKHSGQQRGRVSRRRKGSHGDEYLLSQVGAGLAGMAGSIRGNGTKTYFGASIAMGVAADTRRGQTTSSAILTNSIAGAAGMAAKVAVDNGGAKAMQSFASFLTSFKWGEEAVKGFNSLVEGNPRLASILSQHNFAFAAAALTIPLAHTFAQRKLARQSGRGRRGQDVMATIQATNPAGRPTPQQQGDVAMPQRPPTTFKATGQVRSHFNPSLNGLL